MAFEVGQRVRILSDYEWGGETGTIVGPDPEGYWDYEILMDRRFNDDNDRISDENGNSWFNEDELVAVSKFKVGEKVRLAENNGYLELGPEGIVLSTEGPNASYPYKVVVVQPDGTLDALAFAEDELEAI